MTQYEAITLEIEGRGVARLCLNRPARHNALNAVMIAELIAACRRIADDEDVRVVVLEGRGKTFCAGGDLEWMKQQFDAAPEDRIEQAGQVATMLRSIDELPKFVIGVIEGAAYGGGVGLAAVCDLVIAGPDMRLALTETKLGLIPATIAPFLHRRIGAAALRRLALHGETFDSAEAKQIGLVSQIASKGKIASETEHHIAQALNCAPGAIAEAKRLFRRIAAGEVSDKESINALAQRWSTAEARAGIAAFFNKEKAPWQK